MNFTIKVVQVVGYLSFPFQLDRLVVFQLSYLLKAGVHLIQGEKVKLLNVVPRLDQDSGSLKFIQESSHGIVPGLWEVSLGDHNQQHN